MHRTIKAFDAKRSFQRSSHETTKLDDDDARLGQSFVAEDPMVEAVMVYVNDSNRGMDRSSGNPHRHCTLRRARHSLARSHTAGRSRDISPRYTPRCCCLRCRPDTGHSGQAVHRFCILHRSGRSRPESTQCTGRPRHRSLAGKTPTRCSRSPTRRPFPRGSWEALGLRYLHRHPRGG